MGDNLRDFFEPAISSWKRFSEPERFVTLTYLGIGIFLIIVLKLHLFTDHLEIPLGIGLGTLIGSVLYFNKAQTSLEHTQKAKQQN
jgi:hypothetical protein